MKPAVQHNSAFKSAVGRLATATAPCFHVRLRLKTKAAGFGKGSRPLQYSTDSRALLPCIYVAAAVPVLLYLSCVPVIY